MRRLLGVCALAAGILLLFGLTHRGAASALAAARSESPEAVTPTSAQSLPVKAIVVANGVSVRALAVDMQGGADLTNAAQLNRVVALPAASTLQADRQGLPITALSPIVGVGQAGSRGDGGPAHAEVQLSIQKARADQEAELVRWNGCERGTGAA